MARLTEIPGRLYRGEVSVNFVGNARRWYTISGLILLISIIALATRGLNFSVDFSGGSILQFAAPHSSIGQIHNAVAGSAAGSQAIVQSVGTGWQVQSAKLNFGQMQALEQAIAHAIHVTGGFPAGFSPNFVGPTWGGEVSSKATEALIIFLIVIVIYLSIAFEWKMATAAFVALMHDIVITVGVYALAGFTVSPASVIGLLTILGYSLYDTVVVFDKVRENTAGLLGSGKSTYSQAANLALNQTLVRSINTSLIALLPVAGILFIGSALLGPGELQDLALVLFVGMMSGTYSSIFIATPVLANLKEREHQYKALAKRVGLREAGGRAARRQAEKSGKAAAAAAKAQAQTAASPAATMTGEPDMGAVTGGPPAAATAPRITIHRGGRSAVPPASQDEIVDTGAGYTGEPQDFDDDTGEAEDSTVAAGQAAGGTAARGPMRPVGPRQQPRRTTAASRRPSGKKKKR
ncbi:MAG TPA: protein translocase subunit SecF [Streptosporangiaceae bacterium]|jgi:preprotein translocase subunit SecF